MPALSLGGRILTITNQIVVASLLIKLPLYGHDRAHFALYYLIQMGSGCGPAILKSVFIVRSESKGTTDLTFHSWAAEVTGHDVSPRDSS